MLRAARWFLLACCGLAAAGASDDNLLQQAVESLQSEDFAVAAPLLEQYLEANPEHLEARFNLAFAYAQLGDDDKAIAAYQKVVELKPDLPQARMNLGMLLLRAARPAEAEPHFAKLVKLRPDDAQANYYLGYARAATGRLEEALEPYRKAIEADPTAAQAALDLGRALAKLERFSEAEPLYLKAAELDPSLATMQLELAEQIEQSGGVQAAIALYRRYLDANPGEAAVAERIGFLLLDRDQAAEAARFLEQAAKISPTSANQAALAEAYARAHDSEKSLAMLAQAVQGEPSSTDLRMRFANALLHASRFEQAGAEYFQVTKLDPARLEAWSGMAFCLFREENLPAALRALEEAAKRGPLKPASVYLRAISQDKLQLYEQAQQSYETFLAADPDMPDEEWKSKQRLIVIEKVLSKR